MKKLSPTMLLVLNALGSRPEKRVEAIPCRETRTLEALERRGMVELIMYGSWYYWKITQAGRSTIENKGTQ